MNWRRTYIAVYCKHDIDGKVTPLEIIWNDRYYPIDRIVDVQRRAATKAGGCGLRYTCFIQGKERYLFYDLIDKLKWFVEEQVDTSC